MKIDSFSSQYGFEVHKISLRFFIGKVKVFIYIITMNDIDKFYSDADRLASRAVRTGTEDAKKIGTELSRMFLLATKEYGEIGKDIEAYWNATYKETLSTESGRRVAIDWLGSALALLSGCFTPAMNFPDSDWAEIRDIISAEADTLDIDLLMSIMSVIVDRGKA